MTSIQFFISKVGEKEQKSFGYRSCVSYDYGSIEFGNLCWLLSKYNLPIDLSTDSKHIRLEVRFVDDERGTSIRTYYIHRETFYTSFMDENKEYFSDEEREEAKRQMANIKRPHRIFNCVALVCVIAFLWGLFSFFNHCSDYRQEEADKEKAGWNTERMRYDTDAATLSLDNETTINDSTKIAKWSSLDGDTATCRKNFLKMMHDIYSDKSYDRHPERITAEIMGNTLCLYSFSFDYETAPMIVENEFYQYITDCDFDTVRIYTHKGGGEHYRVCYTRGDVKWDIDTTKLDMPKAPNITFFDHITGNAVNKLNAYTQVCEKFFKNREQKVKRYREEYRRNFIAQKESLYKARNNK